MVTIISGLDYFERNSKLALAKSIEIYPTVTRHLRFFKYLNHANSDVKNLLLLKKNIYILQFIFIQVFFNNIKTRHGIL